MIEHTFDIPLVGALGDTVRAALGRQLAQLIPDPHLQASLIAALVRALADRPADEGSTRRVIMRGAPAYVELEVHDGPFRDTFLCAV